MDTISKIWWFLIKLFRTVKNQIFPKKFGQIQIPWQTQTSVKCCKCWLKATTVVIKTHHPNIYNNTKDWGVENPPRESSQEEFYYCEWHRK